MCLHLVGKKYILIVYYVQCANLPNKREFTNFSAKQALTAIWADSSLKLHSMHNFYLIKHSWRYFLHSISLPNSITKNKIARLRMHKCSNTPISHRYVDVQLFEPKIYILPLKLTAQKITLCANYKCITVRMFLKLMKKLLKIRFFFV